MAGSIAVMMDLHLTEIIYCAAAANLPDQLEKIGGHRIMRHRSWTHELFLWLAPLLFLFIYHPGFRIVSLFSAVGSSASSWQLPVFRTWVFFLPGLFHLAGDVMTPRGIQLAGQKISLRLFETGRFMEYLVAGLFVLIAFAQKMEWGHFVLGK